MLLDTQSAARSRQLTLPSRVFSVRSEEAGADALWPSQLQGVPGRLRLEARLLGRRARRLGRGLARRLGRGLASRRLRRLACRFRRRLPGRFRRPSGIFEAPPPSARLMLIVV